MLIIDKCADYDMATNYKIGYIQTYLKNDHANIEYIIYTYGFAEALTEYKLRFGNRNIEPTVLMLDLATLIIDKVISVYQVYNVAAAADAEAEAEAEADAADDDTDVDFEAEADAAAEAAESEHDIAGISSIYCENPTEASLNGVADEDNTDVNYRVFSPSVLSLNDTEVHSDNYDDDYDDY